MDRTTLIGVNLGCGWLLDDLNGSQLSWLLVVFDSTTVSDSRSL